MSRTTGVTLGSQLNSFVNELIETGRYASTSEVVRNALRLLEKEENEAKYLQAAIQAGLASGESDLTLSAIAQQIKQKHHV